ENTAPYAHMFRMQNGRIYNFIRAFHHDPNYLFSDDDGSTWTYGGRWLYGKGGYSPYLKFPSDGKGAVHCVATEDPPRNFDTSIYHGYLKDGVLYHSDGKVVGKLNNGNEETIGMWHYTQGFVAERDHAVWI